MGTIEQEIEKARASLLSELMGEFHQRQIKILDTMLRILKGQPRPVKHDRKNPKPVKDWEKDEWLAKLKEELREVENAKGNNERAKELSDLITVATSWQNAMGYDFTWRLEIQQATNEKNDSRGAFRGDSDK